MELSDLGPDAPRLSAGRQSRRMIVGCLSLGGLAAGLLNTTAGSVGAQS
jgi:hypothetical protein